MRSGGEVCDIPPHSFSSLTRYTACIRSLRPSRLWRFLQLSLLGLALFFAPSRARAQACCSGGSALTPARLTKYEDVLVGLQMRATRQVGSFGPDGTRYWPPARTSESAFEQDLLGAVRVLASTQLSLQVPFVATRRTTPARRETSWGLGDLNLGARHDFVRAGEWATWPGIAVLAGVTIPTGTPPEKAKRPLATDSTGIGAFQGHIGGAIEQTFGPWLVNLTMLVAQRASRTVGAVRERLGTQIILVGAGGYVLENGIALAVSGTCTLETQAHLGGRSVPDSGRRLVTSGVSGAWPFRQDWRLQGGLFLDLPIPHIGQNQLSNMGGTLALLRTWS